MGFQTGDHWSSSKLQSTSIENPSQASFVFDYDDKNDDIDDLVESIKMRFNKFLQAEYKGTIFDWAKETFIKVNFISIMETTDRKKLK